MEYIHNYYKHTHIHRDTINDDNDYVRLDIYISDISVMN